MHRIEDYGRLRDLEGYSTHSTHQTRGHEMGLTPTQHLASLKLGRDLGQYVAEKRKANQSWGSIAEDLTIDTEGVVNVTREALRLWYGDAA